MILKIALKQYSLAKRSNRAVGAGLRLARNWIGSAPFSILDRWYESDIFRSTRACFGEIEPAIEDHQLLLVRGWIFALTAEISALHVGYALDRLTPAVVFNQPRPDIAATFPGEQHARKSGFGAALATHGAARELPLMFEAKLNNGELARGCFASVPIHRFSGHPYFGIHPVVG